MEVKEIHISIPVRVACCGPRAIQPEKTRRGRSAEPGRRDGSPQGHRRREGGGEAGSHGEA